MLPNKPLQRTWQHCADIDHGRIAESKASSAAVQGCATPLNADPLYGERMSQSELNRIKWCCVGLRDACCEAGRRGNSIFFNNVDEPARFVLQVRAIDKDAEPPLECPSPMTLLSEAAIQFCPWCGANLSRHYRKHLETLGRPDLVMSSYPE